MRKITKLRHSIKAISPIISVLLLIAIAVVASLVVYAWVMGYIGGSTTKAGYAINIQSLSSNTGTLTIYVQNTGLGAVQLNPASAVYVNNTLETITSVTPSGDLSSNGLIITIPQGQTAALVVPWTSNGPVTIKVVTTSGTFMTTTGTSTAGGIFYSVLFTTSGGGGASTISPSGTASYTGAVPITATASAGYTFSGWSASGSITFASASSASTTATVKGAGTVIATFTQTDYQVTFSTSGGGSGSTTSPSTTGSYTMGDPVTITATAGSGYKFSSWTATGSITFASASSASTTATVNGAGAITANFVSLAASIKIIPASSTIPAGGTQGYTATAYDINGNSLGDVTGSTTWSITSGAAGSWSSATYTSANTGIWTVTATYSGLTTTAPLTVYGALASFSFGPINTQTAGLAFPITITAQDANGNPVANFAGTAALTDLSGSISPIITGPFTNGVWTGQVTITKTITNDLITATDSSIAGQSGLFTVNAGAAASFVVSGFTSPVTAGTAGSVTVTAMDASGNVATGYTGTVAITSSDAKAALPQSATLTNGVGTFTVTLNTAGTQTITATDTVTSSITGSQTGITVNAGAAASFVVSGFTSPVTAGTAGSVTVTAEDAYGNVVTGYAGTVAITSSDIQAVLPPNAVLTNGVGSFSVTLKTAGSQSITATDTVTSSITGSQTGITVNAGALASFTISTITSPQTAGTAFPITITAYDQYGNVETGYSGALLSDLSGSLTSTGSFTAGVWTGTVTITKAMATDVITVTDASSGINAQSGAFTVNPGALASFTISAITDPQTAGTAFSITITAYDQYNNVATNYAGPAVLSDVSGSLSPTTATFTAGVYTGSMKITTANTNDVITVTDSGTGVTASSNSFNVVAGSVDHFVFNTISQQTAGTAFTVTITAKDSSGNTVMTYTGSATFTDVSGSISLKSTGVFTNGVLQASVAITKAYTSDVITSTDTTTGANGQSNTFNVVAAPATQLVYTAGTTQSLTTSAVSSVITVQLEDSNGNPVTAGTGGVTISLGSSTTTGTFWSNSGGTTKITSITIPSGSSSASFYYSDTAAGQATLTASSGTLTSATTIFTINGYKLVFTTGATQSLAPGETSTEIQITQETANGGADYNLFTSTTIQLTSSSSTGKFVNSAGTQIYSITVGEISDTSGTFYYIDSSPGAPTLTGYAGGFTSATTVFTIYSATLSSFTVTASGGGNIGTQAVGTSFSITITAIDQNGKTYTGYTVTNTLSASTGAITPTTTGTFVAGVWTGSVTLNTAGSISISTSGSGATGTSNTFTVYTPTLTSFSFGTISGTKTAGTSFSVTITAKDQNGNTMAGFTGSATLTETGGGAGGTVSPSSVTFTSGVYTGNVYVTKSGSGVTITATSGTATGVSGAFTVNIGAVVKVTVSPATDSVTAGSQVTYTATGTDTYGNTGSITDSVTWSISSGAGGSWSTNVYTSNTAGTWTVTANAGGGVTGTATLTVTAGALSQFVFSHIGTQTSGTAFTVTITAEDQYGNTVSYSGTQTLHVSSGSATLTPTTVTFTNGVATPSVTITVSSSRSLDLYITYDGNEDTSNTFTV